MEVFLSMDEYGHEEIAFCYDRWSGLRSIIAIHDTTLGPALGGCRMWPYASEDEALQDVLRLSRGMTYKNAAMGLDLGGGKAVILADPRRDKSEVLFRAFGRFVQSLGGRYITAEDVGVTVADMAVVRMETRFVAGLVEASGDPSPATAFGVWRGIKACARWVWGSESLKGRTVAVQGVGKVGYHLARHLHDEGAQLFISDVDEARAQAVGRELEAEVVKAEHIYDVPCHIFSPCALGAVINDDTLPRLRCAVVAGSANNQLAEPRHGEALREKGILYAPDFLINGGGVINVADEFEEGGYNRDRAFTRVATIYDKLWQVFSVAREEGIPTSVAADRVAEQRIEAVRPLRRIYLPTCR
ncbi:MAG TPA: Glu/Leu/Phe/Val dehydrogenase [Firmicutes bacterium]|nr:Glu/Leu/Phe/Val dehydrogenase [Bacillota bacterium]